MSQPIQLSLPRTSHHNQGLFSDYYLDNILPQQWHALKDEAAITLKKLQSIYDKFTPNPNNEAQTEDDWIKPVLREIGHIFFDVQVPLTVPHGTQKPDYIFYNDEIERNTHKGKVLNEADLKNSAYAIGDAKKWDRSLDKTSNENDAFNNKNPSYQIFFYMLHSGLPWGLLTNGRQWRLYHYLTAHKLDVFYEVDLPALLKSNDPDEFLYFYAFFRQAAFEDGFLPLEHILTASTELAQSVSDDLRKQVYDALRYVAQGFLDYPDNGLVPDPETCKQIYDNSLTLLYRLLFIFYAEARELLPLQKNVKYRDHYSLYSVKKAIANGLYEELLPNSGIIWPRLKTLFNIINLGNPPLNVTTFNGGLFDPKRHEFLERYIVGDLNLCRAIDKLARVNAQFVDYRDLAVRHLGTIYEGLLEYKLQVAVEPMIERKSDSKIVPAQDVLKKDKVAEFQIGEVYLVTDSGERKVTGSYYTPDYIVKYMVDQTLGPVLHDAIEGAKNDFQKIQAVLAVNVLDPSMGSGHFPVEVVEYIARCLVELGVQPEETSEADMAYWKRRVAQQWVYGVDLNPLAVELAKLSLWLVTAANDRPLSFLDHHLRVGNALIGSWLSEIAADKHLGLQEHKKKKTKIVKEAMETGQLSLLSEEEFQQSTSSALNFIASIERNPGNTIQNVKDQEAAYIEQRQRFSERYRRLGDLGVAMYFLDVDNKLWKPLADYALGKAIALPPQFERIRQEAADLAKEKCFFHWELEFPDIFFDQQGQPLGEKAGFDVVIGNPPYVRQEQLSADKPYFRQSYQVFHGNADLFVYFFAQGLKLLRKDGVLAFISSNAWLRANYATSLRRYLRTETTIETIVDLGDNRVFADAPDLMPAIQIVRNTIPSDEYKAKAAIFVRGEHIGSFNEKLINKLFSFFISKQSDSGWQLTEDTPRVLFTKLMAMGIPLGEVINKRVYLGVKTALNDAFIIDQTVRDQLVSKDPACSILIKPLLRGEDLRPWYQENEGRWLICIPNGWTASTFSIPEMSEDLAWKKLVQLYPSLARYLEPFAEAARNRLDKGKFWWELRPCDYYDEFEQTKIFWPPIGKFPRFSWDEKGLFVNNAGFFLMPPDISLLGIVQSRVCWFCITQLCTPLGERAGLMRYQQFMQFIVRLPIPKLTEVQREQIKNLVELLTERARQRYRVRHKTAQRILGDLGYPQAKLNKRLALWWELSFKDFRNEIVKIFKRDISLKERDDWEEFLQERSSKIARLTSEIISLETELNALVYTAFGLNEDEIKLIEQETKFSYGEW